MDKQVIIVTLWPGKFPRTSRFCESCSEILKCILTNDLNHILSFVGCVCAWGMALGGAGIVLGLEGLVLGLDVVSLGFGFGRVAFRLYVWGAG